MVITIKDGYVDSYATTGTIVDGVEVDQPEDLEYFENHSGAYKLVDGKLVYDKDRDTIIQEENTKNDLRDLRNKECFSVINRGKLWYDSLTPYQISELNEWYNAWLRVTETLKVPEKPEFL